MLLTLYDQYGNEKAELQANDSSTQDKEVQADNVLSLGFTLYEHVAIDVNDYVDFGGERYWAMEKYEPAEKSSVEWEYSLKLYGIESLIKRFLVLNNTDGENEAVFTLTARPVDHVRLIVKCINDGMDQTTNFKVGSVEGTDNVVINYEGKYCDEALKELAEAVGVEWWFDGETVNLSRCEWGSAVVLGYGEGLTSLEQDKADNVKFYTRLFPIGSSRNIDRERYGASRLQLPGGAKYVDMGDLVQKYGVIHHYEQEAFSGIYPRRVGVVSSVRSEEVQDSDGKPFTIYHFKDNGLTFDPNAYEIGGLVKHVSFQEGSELAGLGADNDHYFEVNFDSETREFEIITIWPYDDDRQLPGDTLVPKPGDKYILWNIRMPDEYYTLAETEFQSAVEEYNRKHTQDVSRYKGETDHVWIEESGTELEIGRRVRLKSQEYFPRLGYRESRITRISRIVNLPSRMDLEISDALSTGSLDKIDDAISDAKSYAGSLFGSLTVPDLIRSWESTKPTDSNIYSARRTHKEFLSKKTDDKAKGHITFEDGITVDRMESGGDGPVIVDDDLEVAENLEVDRDAQVSGDMSVGGNAEFSGALSDPSQNWYINRSGEGAFRQLITNLLRSNPVSNPQELFGEGFLMTLDDANKAHLFTDYLTVRLKAYFAELEIRRLSYVGGSIVLTPAGSKIAYVKWLDADGEELAQTDANRESVVAFKVYQLADDGTLATQNGWRAGDQARCQTFNIDGAGKYEGVSNTYYWRLVTEADQERVLKDFTTVVEGAEGYEDSEVASYIILSNERSVNIGGTECVGYDHTGSDVSGTSCDFPSVGDTLVQMGSQTDPSGRGNVIILRTVSEGSTSGSVPSITMYHEVGGGSYPYTLSGKEMFRVSPDGFEVLSRYFLLKTSPGSEGKAIAQYRGDWSSTAYYNQGDTITYDGYMWECLTANTAVTPVEGPTWRIVPITTGGDFAIYSIDCDTYLVNQTAIAATEPIVLGATMNSTLYAFQFGEYMLKMSEEAIGNKAVITVRGQVTTSDGKAGYQDCVISAQCYKGGSTIGDLIGTGKGSLSFFYSDIEEDADRILITMSDLDGNELTHTSITVIKQGTDGENVIYLDLDNENDSMLYDSSGSLVSGVVQSNITLWDGTRDVTGDAEITAVYTGCTGGLESHTVVVSGMTSPSGTVVVTASYKGHNYRSVLSLKRLSGMFKYDLVCTPNAIPYNITKQSPSSSTVEVNVYKTSSDGTRENLQTLPAGFSLVISYGNNSITLPYQLGGCEFSTENAAYSSYRVDLVDNSDANNPVVWDSETIPITKAEDGADGSDVMKTDKLADAGSAVMLTMVKTETDSGVLITANIAVRISVQVVKQVGNVIQTLQDTTGYTLRVIDPLLGILDPQTVNGGEGVNPISYQASYTGLPSSSLNNALPAAYAGLYDPNGNLVGNLSVPVTAEPSSMFLVGEQAFQSWYFNTTHRSSIEQSAKLISLLVAGLGADESDGTRYSSFDMTESQVTIDTLKFLVRFGKKSSLLFDGDGKIKSDFLSIVASMISLEGYTTINKHFKVLENGDVFMNNATIEGVLNNLINTIDVANSVNTDKLITFTPEYGVDFAGCYYANLIGSNSRQVDCLDALCLGNIVRLQSTNGRDLFLPFYMYEDVPLGGQSRSWYFRTRTRYGGTLHSVTSEELMQLVGKRITILMQNNGGSQSYLYIPVLSTSDVSWNPGQTQPGVTVSTVAVSPSFDSNYNPYMAGIHLNANQSATLEFRMAELYIQETGSFARCFYWALDGYSGELPNWN